MVYLFIAITLRYSLSRIGSHILIIYYPDNHITVRNQMYDIKLNYLY